MDKVVLGFGWYIVFVFSLVLHEAAHAYAAKKGGDPTAYRGGQVTLNPIPHIARDRFGMVIIPILSFWMWGWMIGWASTPFDPFWAERYPRRSAAMALAGPAANLFLVICAVILIRIGTYAGIFVPPSSAGFTTVTVSELGGLWNAVSVIVSILFTLNLVLLIFNLMPIPPLDGSAALPLLIGEGNARSFWAFTRRPVFMLVGLILVWRVFGYIFGPIFNAALNIVYPGVSYG